MRFHWRMAQALQVFYNQISHRMSHGNSLATASNETWNDKKNGEKGRFSTIKTATKRYKCWHSDLRDNCESACD